MAAQKGKDLLVKLLDKVDQADETRRFFQPTAVTVNSFESTQLRREIDGFHPTTSPDLLPFLEGQGPVAPGLDLDGVAGVFLGADFVTVTKGADREWHLMKPAILGVIMEHFTANRPVIVETASGAVADGEDSEIDLSPKPGHEQEFDAWRWVPHRELPELVVPFKRQVYEGVIREFERFVLASRR